MRRAQVSPLAVAAGRGEAAVDVGVGVGVVEVVCIVLDLGPKKGVQVLVVIELWVGAAFKPQRG